MFRIGALMFVVLALGNWAHGQEIIADLSTGVADGGGFIPPGTPDDDWILTSGPSGTGTYPRAATVVNPNPAWAVLSGTQWVSYKTDTSWGTRGLYVYSCAFFVPAGVARPAISGWGRSDNSAGIYLNGFMIGSLPGDSFRSWKDPFNSGTSDKSYFILGDVNYLTIEVSNDMGPSGIDINATAIDLLPWVPADCTIEVFASVPNPTAIAGLPVSGCDQLFVASAFLGDNGVPDSIVRLCTTTDWMEVVCDLPSESDPSAIEFGPCRGDQPRLYVCSNNRDGGQPGDQGGSIVYANLFGAMSELFLTPVPPPTVLSEPVSIAFATEGSLFPTDEVFVTNTTKPPFDIATIHLDDGSRGSFMVYESTVAGAIAFGLGGAGFGADLYATKAEVGAIESFDNSGSGVPTRHLDIPGFMEGDRLGGMAFAPRGGRFGGCLYVFARMSGEVVILRVEPTGGTSVFSYGYSSFTSRWDAMAFLGDALYVTDYDRGVVYKITPPQAPALVCEN
ncbi:MAG: hypothetical protein AB1486_02450 [Planctomycetota bacterium]